MEKIDFEWAEACLAEDETILWQGVPVRNKVFEKTDIALIPFSLLWLGFALFWNRKAFTLHAFFMPDFFIFGLVFIIIGLYFVFGRFIYKSVMIKRTAYVITSKRILRKRGKKIDMLFGNSLPQMEVSANADGSGTIGFFTPLPFAHYRGRNLYLFTGDQYTFSLKEIEDVGKVAVIIQSIVPSAQQR